MRYIASLFGLLLALGIWIGIPSVIWLTLDPIEFTHRLLTVIIIIICMPFLTWCAVIVSIFSLAFFGD